MKNIKKRVAIYAIFYIKLFYITSCGPNYPDFIVPEYDHLMVTREEIAKNIGSSYTTKRVPHTNQGAAITHVSNPGQNHVMPSSKDITWHPYSGSEIKPTVPSHANLKQALESYPDTSVPPFLPGFPFFCDPLNYAPNIILSVSACRPFMRAIFPHLGAANRPNF